MTMGSYADHFEDSNDDVDEHIMNERYYGRVGDDQAFKRLVFQE